MKKLSQAAPLAAGATIAMPRAVHAAPRAEPSNPAAMIAQIQAGFEEFKGTIEANLGKKADDTVVQSKLETINADLNKMVKAFDEQAASIAALRLGSPGDNLSPEAAEHAGVFNTWFRKGDRAVDANMRELEVKAQLTTQSDPDGGYIVPSTMEAGIDRVLGTVSAMRGASRVISIGGNEYKKLVSMGGATSGWVGEEDARTETETPKLREIAINTGEIYANPFATQTLLDDALVDIAAWLADEVSIEFGEQEAVAFLLGNGKKKPRGLLTYDTVANASYGQGKASAWGKVGFVTTGKAGGFADIAPADALSDLYYALRSGYRNGASFLVSDATTGTMRKWKDGQGNYLWAPPTADMPATFLGKPVLTDDNMPAVEAGAFPIAFGNFQRAYTIIDRQGVRVLRDPYTNKPFVGFYTTKRVGGGVTNFEAVKLLKVAA